VTVRRLLAASAALALGLGGALVVAAPAQAAALTVTSAVDDGLPGSLSYELGQLDPGVVNTIDITVGGIITGPAAGFPTIFDDVVITSSATTRPVLLMNAGGGSLSVSGAKLTMTGIDIVSDTPASGQGLSVLNGSAELNDVSIRDFSLNLFYVDNSGGYTLDLTDVDLGGTVVAPSFIGVAVEDHDGGISFTRVAVSNTDSAGIVFDVRSGDLDLDTVSAEDGAGITLQGSAATVTAAHVTVARTSDGFGAYLDGGTLDLSDLTAVTTGDLGATIEAINGAIVTVTNADISASADSGISLGATDSTLTATGITSYGNGLLPGCGCGGSGSGIELYADNSTVTLTGANAHDNDATFGGGIYVGEVDNASGVTISGATVAGNTASDDGGGIYVTGVQNDGSSLTIRDTVVSANTSIDFGGGIYLFDIGAGVTSTATVTIVRTTVDGNTGGGYGGGIAIDDPAAETTGQPTVLIDSSTLSNNTTPYGGGGIHIRRTSTGDPAVVKILNTTISDNDAQQGGGVDVAASSYPVGGGGPGGPGGPGGGTPGPSLLTTVIIHSTIVANSAHTSATVAVNQGDQTLDLDNSILAGGTSNNGSAVDDLDVGAPFTLRYSLVQAPRAGVIIPTGVGNITGVDPKLGPLALNGGTTKTHLVSPGSPAYNAGDPSFTGAGLFDQRGLARVYQIVDMGAVEWQPALAHTGSAALTPETPLIGLLLLLAGLAMVAFSRLQLTRS
jgi:predicted outer membrane repeat protein